MLESSLLFSYPSQPVFNYHWFSLLNLLNLPAARSEVLPSSLRACCNGLLIRLSESHLSISQIHLSFCMQNDQSTNTNWFQTPNLYIPVAPPLLKKKYKLFDTVFHMPSISHPTLYTISPLASCLPRPSLSLRVYQTYWILFLTPSYYFLSWWPSNIP